jgi:gamma-glutamylcysteine synthetase
VRALIASRRVSSPVQTQNQRRIGTEHEKFGYQKSNLRPMEYDAHVKARIPSHTGPHTTAMAW